MACMQTAHGCGLHHDLLRGILHVGHLLHLALQLALPGLQAGLQLQDELPGCFKVQRLKFPAPEPWVLLPLLIFGLQRICT